ncbi:MAG TPA: CopG family transcriptional regulator [Candidatus Pacearchaeota archaeon]|nr:hypothetical protein BMS3Abin17_00759 [archaeon BMS3Abin17]HDK42616.1 CopG family transcriptional regulator [Candidatus Pacearchaeota archaeon]HDZ60869.1 CopG family transcriptional regulator [Candidatus Pacearchaeota archaeon]
MPKSNPKAQEIKKDKIPVTFNDEQVKLIEDYSGIMGNTKAEIIRNIVINWLLERGGKKNDK